MVPGITQDRNMRSRCRCSMCPAIHITSRSWLRSSSTHEPSDPPLRVVFGLSRWTCAINWTIASATTSVFFYPGRRARLRLWDRAGPALHTIGVSNVIFWSVVSVETDHIGQRPITFVDRDDAPPFRSCQEHEADRDGSPVLQALSYTRSGTHRYGQTHGAALREDA